MKNFIPTLQEDAHKDATNGNGKQEDVDELDLVGGEAPKI